MFIKKALCSAIGTTLAAAAGLAHGYYSEWLVPYVVKDTNRTTVVTLIGWGEPQSNTDTLHLQYWTKSTTDANTAACQPSSVYVPFTESAARGQYFLSRSASWLPRRDKRRQHHPWCLLAGAGSRQRWRAWRQRLRQLRVRN